MRLNFSLAAILAALVSACATPQAPLSQIKPGYPSVDVAMIDDQDGIYITLGEAPTAPAYYYVPPGTSPAAAAAGGALGFLIIAGINAAEAADAKKDAAPLRAALKDFDYGPTLLGEIESSLPLLTWTSVEEISRLKDANPKTLAAIVQKSDAAGMLVVGASYYLSRNADTAVVFAQALLHPVPARSPDAKPMRNAPPAVYATSVSYEMPSPTGGDRRADNIPAWSANDAEALRAALSRGAVKVAELLTRQLETGGEPFKTPSGQKAERRIINSYGAPLKVKVQVLESGPDGELVRVEDGALRFLAKPYSADANKPLPRPLAPPEPLPDSELRTAPEAQS